MHCIEKAQDWLKHENFDTLKKYLGDCLMKESEVTYVAVYSSTKSRHQGTLEVFNILKISALEFFSNLLPCNPICKQSTG